jgi:putative PIN family toxin of toxin-antitoxin system
MISKPRIVIDTSSLIGAMLRPNSIPRQAFLNALSTHTLIFSNSTFQELQTVLHRNKFDRYVPLSKRLEFLALIKEHSNLWDIDEASEHAAIDSCRDPKDEKFLALALSCNASALISSDADLLVLHPWQEVKILTPAAFVSEKSLTFKIF